MSSTPLADAELAVIAALTAGVSGARIEGEPDRLREDTVVVGSAGATWGPHRYMVTVQAEIYTAGNRPSLRDARAIDLVDQVVTAIQSVDTGAVYWGGPGTELEVGEIEETDVDGTIYGNAIVTGTVMVERPGRYATRGPAEQIVYDVLTDAGLPVVDTADKGEFVVCRWTGSAPDDPWFEQVAVYPCAPSETGTIEALARRTWNALYESDQMLVNSDVSVDFAGSPPGSELSHATAQIFVQVLVVPRKG